MSERRRFISVGLCAVLVSSVGLPLQAWSGVDENRLSAKTRSGSETSRRILVLGDSLSAEYGLPQGSGWVTHVAERLNNHDTGYQIHNSSISGDTTSGGTSRLPAELERIGPDIVVIALGANDALRGLSLEVARENLSRMIGLAQASGARVVLIGMQIPPNYGPRYAREFAALFPDLAESYQATLVPFLLEGFATQPDMFLDDGIHPNQAAQSIMADTVWEYLAPLLVSGKQ